MPPPATCTTLLKLAGMFVNAGELPPQAATVPSARIARLWESPAPTAMAFVTPGGTRDWPLELLPQAVTVPVAAALAVGGSKPGNRGRASSNAEPKVVRASLTALIDFLRMP